MSLHLSDGIIQMIDLQSYSLVADERQPAEVEAPTAGSSDR